MSPCTSPHAPRELAARVIDSVDVQLVWNPDSDEIFVVFTDELAAEQRAIRVDPAEALDAYQHPYLYLARSPAGAVAAAA